MNFMSKLNIINNLKESEFNIFFVETNENKYELSPKQLCSIESAAFNNPTSLITIYAPNITINKNLTQMYKNIQIRKLIFEDVLKDTPLLKWFEKYNKEIKTGPYRLVHMSDALRLALILKYGGIYMDTDIITMKNLKNLLEFPGVGAEDNKWINNAVLNFPINHTFINILITEYIKNYNPTCWACKGPLLITNLLAKYCNSTNIIQTHQLTKEKLLNKTNFVKYNKCNTFVYPVNYFYLISPGQSSLLFKKNSNIKKEIFDESYGIHLWNKVTNNFHYKHGEESIFKYFANLNCPYTYKSNLFI